MYPKQMTLMSMLSDELQEKEQDELLVSPKSSLSKLLEKEGLKQKIEILNKLNPQLARSMQTFIYQLELLSTEGVMLISPSYSY